MREKKNSIELERTSVNTSMAGQEKLHLGNEQPMVMWAVGTTWQAKGTSAVFFGGFVLGSKLQSLKFNLIYNFFNDAEF
jgi:hypothetical protein